MYDPRGRLKVILCSFNKLTFPWVPSSAGGLLAHWMSAHPGNTYSGIGTQTQRLHWRAGYRGREDEREPHERTLMLAEWAPVQQGGCPVAVARVEPIRETYFRCSPSLADMHRACLTSRIYGGLVSWNGATHRFERYSPTHLVQR